MRAAVLLLLGSFVSCSKNPQTTLSVKGETFAVTLIQTRPQFKQFLGWELGPKRAFVVAYPAPRFHYFESPEDEYDVVFTDAAGKIVETQSLRSGDEAGISSSGESTHAVFFQEGTIRRLALQPGHPIDYSPPLRENLPRLLVPLRINGQEVRAQTAVTPSEQRHGFMFWRRLSRDDGLIFVYPREEHHGFWMGNCYLDLDIAFFRADGTLINVVETRRYEDPKKDPKTRSKSLAPAQYVVETNYGWFRAHGLIRDDGAPSGAVRLEIPPDVDR